MASETLEFKKLNIDLQKAYKEIKKQNMELVRKTIELTELKERLEDKNLDLQQAYGDVKKTLQAKTEFLNKAAHDLRTPLTPILTLLPIVQKRTRDEESKYNLKIVYNNAKYLNTLVEELLELVRTEAMSFKYNFKKIKLQNLVQEVIENHKIVFQENCIKVICKISESLPEVAADKSKMIEVLQNLLSNAIKFTPKGGGIAIKIRKIDNFINVRVEDTGIGMSKKTLSRLFEEFYKADESRHYPGSGLGLSICKRIIEAHKGRIWAESGGHGKGSVLAFSIPLKQEG